MILTELKIVLWWMAENIFTISHHFWWSLHHPFTPAQHWLFLGLSASNGCTKWPYQMCHPPSAEQISNVLQRDSEDRNCLAATQQWWICQLLRGNAPLLHPSTLKLVSLSFASGASLSLTFYPRPPPPSEENFSSGIVSGAVLGWNSKSWTTYCQI